LDVHQAPSGHRRMVGDYKLQQIVLDAGAGNELDPGGALGLERRVDAQPARDRRQRRPLHQYGREHDKKDHVEDGIRLLQPGNQRERRQNDRRGASEAHPGDEHLLPQVHARPDQCGKHGQWAGDQHQEDREQQALGDNRTQLGRKDQQAQR